MKKKIYILVIALIFSMILATSCSNLIHSHSSNEEECSCGHSHNQENQEIISEQMNSLNFGEYKYIEIDNEVIRIEQNTYNTSNMTDITEYFPDYNFLICLDHYSLYITFSEGDESEYEKDFEIDKIYKRNTDSFIAKNILAINLIMNKDKYDIFISINSFNLNNEGISSKYNQFLNNLNNEKSKADLNDNLYYNGFQEDCSGNLFTYLAQKTDNTAYYAYISYVEHNNNIEVDNKQEGINKISEYNLLNFIDDFITLIEQKNFSI